MKLTNKGIVDANIAVKNLEINPDELHYYKFELITQDQIVVRYDVTKAIQDWGVVLWFSHAPAGKALGRMIPVTHQTDVDIKVDNGAMVLSKQGVTIDKLFDIIPDMDYYINVHNLQSNDNFYYLVIGPEEPPVDIC